MPRLTVILLMAAVVLLPMVPAFVLFKYLHSKAKLTGPLAGFNVVLGGAFAGYVVVLIVIVKFLMPSLMPAKPPAPCDVWTVTGRAEVDGDPAAVSWAGPQGNLRPPDLHFFSSDGRFTWQIGILTDSTGAFGPTTIELMLAGHHAPVVMLDGPDKKEPPFQDYGVTYDAKEKTITIGKPINLVRDKTPYSPPAGQPTPVAASGVQGTT